MNLNLNLKLMGKMPVTMDEKRDEEQKQQETAEKTTKAEGAPAPELKAVTASVQDVLAAYAKGDIKLISTTGKDMPEINEGVTQFTYDDSKVTTYLNKGSLSIEVRGNLNPSVIKDFPIKKWPDLKPVTPPDDEPVGVVNGEIDESVSQGGTGDCWIIAGVLALNGTESGKKIIKEAIQVNGDGSVTVHFKGLNVSYTITAAEIKKHDTDKIKNDAYSNGDNDMLVLELATKKLMADIASGKVKLDVPEDSPEAIYNEDGSIEGGFAQNMIYYLTGTQADFIYAYDDNTKGLSQKEVLDFLKNAYQEGNNALTFGIYGKPHRAKLVDGTTYSLDISGGHALAITELTDTTVTFVNPWDSTIKYTMTWEEFAKLGVGMITSTPLPKAEDTNPSEPADPVEPEPVNPEPVEPEPVEPEPVVPVEPEPEPVTPDPVAPDPVDPEPVVPVEPEPLLPDSNATVYSAKSLKNVPQDFIDRCLEPVSYNADGSVKEYKLKADYDKIEFSTNTIKINGVEINHIRVVASKTASNPKRFSINDSYEYYTKADLDKLFGNDPFWKEAFDQYFDCVDKEKGLYRVKFGYSLYELANGYAHYDTRNNRNGGGWGISCNATDTRYWNHINYKGRTVYHSKVLQEQFNPEIIDTFFMSVKNDNGELVGYALKAPYTDFNLGYQMIGSKGYSESEWFFSYETDNGERASAKVIIGSDGSYRFSGVPDNVVPEPVTPEPADPVEPEPVAPVDPLPLVPDSNATVYSAESLRNIPKEFIDKFLQPVSYNADGSVKEYKRKANCKYLEFTTRTIQINGVKINRIHIVGQLGTSNAIAKPVEYDYYTKADLDKVIGNDPFWKEAFDQYFDCVDKEKGLYSIKPPHSIEDLQIKFSRPHETSMVYKFQNVYHSKAIKMHFNSEIIDKFFKVVKNDDGEVLGYALKKPFTNFSGPNQIISSSGRSESTYAFYYNTKDGKRHITELTISNDGSYKMREMVIDNPDAIFVEL